MLNDKKDMKDSCKESLGGRSRMGTVTVMIAPTPPYDHNLTASHITFNSARYGADVYEDEHYLRVLEMDGRLVLVDVAWNGDVEAPKLSVEAYGDGIGEADAPAIKRMVGWLLGAHQDLEPFYRIALADDRLALLVRRFHGLHVPQTAPVFEAIIMAILGQQVSSAVARVMRNALVEAYGARMEHRCQSYRAFPSPERLAGASIEELRRLKLSGRKAEYVLDISEGVTVRGAGPGGAARPIRRGDRGRAVPHPWRRAVDGALAADPSVRPRGWVSSRRPGAAAARDGGAAGWDGGRRGLQDDGRRGAGGVAAMGAVPELRDDVPVRGRAAAGLGPAPIKEEAN